MGMMYLLNRGGVGLSLSLSLFLFVTLCWRWQELITTPTGRQTLPFPLSISQGRQKHSEKGERNMLATTYIHRLVIYTSKKMRKTCSFSVAFLDPCIVDGPSKATN